MPRLLRHVAALLFCAAPVSALCQLPDLPSAPAQTAPAAPAKPSLILPPASYDRPTGAAPNPKKDWVCDAPPTGIFVDAFELQTEKKGEVENKKGELENYIRLVRSQIYNTWISDLPRSARSAWAKGRLVKVRLAILPDGSFPPPELTVSSGKSEYDSAAIRAIRQHGAFPPPPPGDWKSVAVCLSFSSNNGLPENPPSWSDVAK